MADSPPAAPAYMLSLLKRRLASAGTLTSGPDEGHWLVWEPGKWSASGGFDPTLQPAGIAAAATGHDSLSFHLKVKVPLKLGRSSTCDLLLNDATVSREHLVLEPVAEGWSVKVLSVAGITEVDGTPVRHGESRPLASGATLRVGDVRLTFLDAPAMRARLEST